MLFRIAKIRHTYNITCQRLPQNITIISSNGLILVGHIAKNLVQSLTQSTEIGLQEMENDKSVWSPKDHEATDNETAAMRHAD